MTTAILFDVDGVLLDTGRLFDGIWAAWARSVSLAPDWVVSQTHGRRTGDVLRAVAPQLDPDAQRAALDALVLPLMGTVRPMPGAGELLHALNNAPGSGAATPWAIVTSGSRWFVDTSFGNAGIPVPAVAVYGEDVEHGKPAPDGYLTAARRLGVLASDCTVVEDSPDGVAAARAAGCMVIAVATTHDPVRLGAADTCVPTLADAGRLLRKELTHD
jgi:mannitol-1-/sugar-/sorbitol-6-phosphatase